MYDLAIDSAAEHQYNHWGAVMNERAAALMNKPKLSAGYILEANELWARVCDFQLLGMS